MKIFHIFFFLLIISFSSLAQSDEDNLWISYMGDSIAASMFYEGAYIDTLFNRNIFLDKIIIQKDDPNIKEFNDYFVHDLFGNFKIGSLLSTAIKKDDSYYDYLNHYVDVDGNIHILCRLFSPDGGVNYHDFQMSYIDIDSSYQIVDIYIYFSGEDLTETYRQVYKNLLREKLEKITGVTNKTEAASSFNILQKARQLKDEGKPEEGMALFYTIPKKYQEQRHFRFWKVDLALDLEDVNVYANAMKEFEEAYPDDPSLFLLAIDKYTVLGDYQQALRYINKLDVKVGLDPILNYYRGNINYEMNNVDQAIADYEATREIASFNELYINLFALYLETNQDEKAIETLNHFLKDIDLEKRLIEEWVEEDYVDFTKKEIYLDWKKLK